MRAVLQRLLGLQKRDKRTSSRRLSEPQLRIDSYHRLDNMDGGGILGRHSPSVKPLQAGDAAALGHRVAGREQWIKVDVSGKAELIQVDKQELAHRLWIPVRDLLQVDPMIPIAYPSSIFIRERAMIVNLESVRMIIAKDEAFVTSIPVQGSSELWQHPTLDAPFTRELSERVKSSQAGASNLPPHLDLKMPFELKALEVALAAAVSVLELAVGNLEKVAFPALDNLVFNVSREELDKTRNVKSVTTHLINRVRRFKTELEEILDDDQDMADMYLGMREELENAEPDFHSPRSTGRNSASERVAVDLRSTSDTATLPDPATLGRPWYSSEGDVTAEASAIPHIKKGGPRQLRTAHPHDIEECENLLENYFMQVEFLYSRLMQLKERTDHTEDLINIELDQRRNELVSLDLILTALATAFGFVACVGGIFGMNLAPMPIESTEVGFWAATFGAITAGLALLVGFLGYAYHKKILLIPSN